MSYVLKHKQNIYIFFSFAYKTLRAIINVFPIIFFWWKIYSLPFIFIYKRFNFCYSFLNFFLNYFLLLIGCMAVFSFFYPVQGIDIWFITTWIYFMRYIIQQLNLIEEKLTTIHLISFWYLFLSKLKSCFLTSSAPSLIMICML